MTKPKQPQPKPSGGRHFDYVCTVCGRDTARDKLTVKRVDYVTMGRKFKRIKMRTAGWLCPDCLALDPQFNQQPHEGSPSRVQELKNMKEKKDGA